MRVSLTKTLVQIHYSYLQAIKFLPVYLGHPNNNTNNNELMEGRQKKTSERLKIKMIQDR